MILKNLSNEIKYRHIPCKLKKYKNLNFPETQWSKWTFLAEELDYRRQSEHSKYVSKKILRVANQFLSKFEVFEEKNVNFTKKYYAYSNLNSFVILIKIWYTYRYVS